MSKSTDAEILLRIATIIEMLTKGQDRQDIIQYASKTWNVSDRTGDEYIAKAREKIKRNKDAEIDYHISMSIIRYQDLYKRNFNIQDYRECRQVQGDIVKLLGIAEAQKIDVTSKGDKIEGSPIIVYNPQGEPPDEL